MNRQKIVIAGTVSLALVSGVGAQPSGSPGPNPYAIQDPSYSLEGPPPGMLDSDGMTVGPQRLPVPPGPIPPRALRRRDFSWIYIDRPRPRKVGVHDIITVIVDEKSEVTQNSRFNRQRNIIFNAILREFIRLNSKGNLDTAAAEAPGIQSQMQSQMQSYGQGISNEGMKYRIAATVVDILPNGTLILEAHKSIRTNTEVWEYTLTGRIRTQDVAGNNTVLSENVADLTITKMETGKIKDSAKRGWITRFYDFFLPF